MHTRLCIMFGCGSRDTRSYGRPIVDGIVSFVFATVTSFIEQEKKQNEINKYIKLKRNPRKPSKNSILNTLLLYFLSMCDLSLDCFAFHNPTTTTVFLPVRRGIIRLFCVFLFRSPALLKNTQVTFVHFCSLRFSLWTSIQARRRIFLRVVENFSKTDTHKFRFFGRSCINLSRYFPYLFSAIILPKCFKIHQVFYFFFFCFSPLFPYSLSHTGVS